VIQVVPLRGFALTVLFLLLLGSAACRRTEDPAPYMGELWLEDRDDR